MFSEFHKRISLCEDESAQRLRSNHTGPVCHVMSSPGFVGTAEYIDETPATAGVGLAGKKGDRALVPIDIKKGNTQWPARIVFTGKYFSISGVSRWKLVLTPVNLAAAPG